MAIAVTTGCQTPSGQSDHTATGALLGGLIGAGTGALVGNAAGHHAAAGAAIGGVAGLITGGIIGHITDVQRSQLQQQSPQTLEKIQHNDDVSQQQPAASPSPSGSSETASAAPSAPSDAASSQMQPLTVDDIKALASAGVKDDAVTAEIRRSNSRFSQQDITDLQQAGVSTNVIDFIKTHAS